MATKQILAVLEDLFFTVKINESAKQAGLPVKFLKTEFDVLDQAQAKPALIILDLNFSRIDPVQVIEKLKADAATKGINLLGFISHVQVDLKQQAQAAGCNMVLARSAFSTNLPQILKRYSE